MKKHKKQGTNKPSSTSTVQMVFISDITPDPSFQSTNRFDQRTVKEYEGKYEAGIPMPPIELAEVNGLKILINGQHRLEAQRSLDRYEVEAVVTPMTMREAYLAAIKANTDSGKQLTLSQKKEKLERLFMIGTYKDENGRPRTFEDIAGCINHAIKPRFISNWMKKKHPRTYYWMKGGKKDPEYKGGGGLRDKKVPLQEDAEAHLSRAELAFYNDKDSFGRVSTIREVEEMLGRMKGYTGGDDDLIFEF